MTADHHAAAAARVAHEDLLIFINAAFACTGQREFYSDGHRQTVAIGFLHEYIRGNYRRLYALALAAGINDYNRARIIVELLAQSRDLDADARAREGSLIAAALAELPPQRAMRALRTLQERRVNNRRTRAIIREYLGQRRDLTFDAVKYRGKVRALVRHAHLALPGELPRFLHRGWRERRYQAPLLEAFRQAHYSQEAIYELPYTIAEGLAARQGIERGRFLERIAPRMSAAERLRLQRSAAREGATIDLDLASAPPTRLALYVLGLPLAERRARLDELDAAMAASARRVLERTPLRLGRIACVLDRSYSSAGSSERSRRPLAVALAARYLLQAAAEAVDERWAPRAPEHPLLVTPRGQSDLATPLLDALEGRPELVVVVSDGADNDPPGAASVVLRTFRERLDPARETDLLHVNPVFEATELGPRPLDPAAPTLGIRDAEDLPTLLAFARFVDGRLGLGELEALLEGRARAMVERYRRRRERAAAGVEEAGG